MEENKSVTLTDGLVAKIKQLRESEDNPELLLRLIVNGGGCQGFEYHFDFETSLENDDHLFEKDGVGVVIDQASLDFLDGSEIDFVEEMIGSSFKINNPNAKSSCGCGTSFSI
jgi:iron-sulfur cluster insertion protein